MVCRTENGKCEKYHFWVLCKGNNAGKPLQKPCPNCFIVVCDTQAERDFYESLCFSLWKAKIFERELIGSVIPFIRLPEFRQVVNHYARMTQHQPEKVLKLADSVNKAMQYEEVIRQQLAKVRQMQMAIVYSFLKSCNP